MNKFPQKKKQEDIQHTYIHVKTCNALSFKKPLMHCSCDKVNLECTLAATILAVHKLFEFALHTSLLASYLARY